MLHLLGLVVKNLATRAHVLTLVEVSVPRLEVLEDLPSFRTVASLSHQLCVFLLACSLQRHVSSLLPFLVAALPCLFAFLNLGSRLVSLLLNDPVVSVDLL